MGRLPTDDAGAPAADHRHLHVETIVIGAGIAGLRAAVEAARTGDRVLLVDERHWIGGTASASDLVDGEPAPAWIEATTAELAEAPEARVLTEATALGIYDDGYVVVYERVDCRSRRLWHVRAGRVVVAAGAHERPIAFADDDRPGVMLASSARLYADRFGVLPGTRAVVFTTNHSGHEAALALADRGLEIGAILDVGEGGPASDRARARGIDVRNGWAVTGTDGDPRISSVHATGPGGAAETFETDLLARGRRVEPGRPAVARDRRRPAVRRGARMLPPRRHRTALARDRGRGRGRGTPDRHAVLVHAGRGSVAALRRPAARLDRRRRARRGRRATSARPST